MLSRTFTRLFSSSLFAQSTVLLPNNVSDNPGARKLFKRVGRGEGSSHGRTCGRGFKGQRARGSIKALMQGGQSTLARRLPKWGFKNPNKKPLETLNFKKLYYFIDRGLVDPTQTITMRVLFEAGIFSQIKHGVSIIATGADKIDRPLHFEVTDATKGAVEAIKAKGGSVTCVYRTHIQQRYHLKPYKYDLPMRDMAMPPPKKLLKLEKMRDKGVELKYVKPNWIDNYVPLEVPVIPQAPKRVKRTVVRFINYGV
mmetsp:Transcript_15695/g.28637  ORF Transcript_15695/g.28637 Transcript_15695/m.28637 type:complete len:255 (+) Transcript_15695:953-1717(+)